MTTTKTIIVSILTTIITSILWNNLILLAALLYFAWGAHAAFYLRKDLGFSKKLDTDDKIAIVAVLIFPIILFIVDEDYRAICFEPLKSLWRRAFGNFKVEFKSPISVTKRDQETDKEPNK